jgi:hypothetical protein
METNKGAIENPWWFQRDRPQTQRAHRQYDPRDQVRRGRPNA